MNCFNLTVSGGAGVGKRADQSQNTILQSYKFEKQEDFFLFLEILLIFYVNLTLSKHRLDDGLGEIYRF